MKYGKLAIPLVIFILSFYFYVVAGSFRQLKAVEQVGPDFWPKNVLFCIMILSGLAFVFDLMEEKNRDYIQSVKKKENWRRLILGVLIPFGYIYLLDYVGFVLITPVFMASFMYFLGARKKWFIASSSVLFPALIIIIFTKILFVVIPRGRGVFRSFSLLFY